MNRLKISDKGTKVQSCKDNTPILVQDWISLWFGRFVALSLCGFVALGFTGCSTTKVVKPVDPDIGVMASAAMKAFARGQVEQAARQYVRALERARAADSPADICDQAYNLAACLLILGQPNDAQPLLREARAAAGQMGRKDTDIRLLEAKAARMSGHGAEAAQLAESLLASGIALAPAEHLQALLIKAEIQCDAGHQPAAAEQDEIRRQALDSDDPAIHAEMAQLEGQCQLLDKEYTHAGAAFDSAAANLQKGGRFREMAQALARAGAAYMCSSQMPEAADRYYRAARSLMAQGDALGALRQIEPALDAAKAAKQDELLARIIALFENIKKAVTPPEKAEKNQ